MEKTLLYIILGVLAVIAVLMFISLFVIKKKIKKQFAELKHETVAWHEIMLKDNESSLKNIEKSVDVMLDGLVLAQTKDKLALVKLIKSRIPVEEKVVEEIKEEIVKQKEVKEEVLKPVKSDFIPVD